MGESAEGDAYRVQRCNVEQLGIGTSSKSSNMRETSRNNSSAIWNTKQACKRHRWMQFGNRLCNIVYAQHGKWNKSNTNNRMYQTPILKKATKLKCWLIQFNVCTDLAFSMCARSSFEVSESNRVLRTRVEYRKCQVEKIGMTRMHNELITSKR